MKNYILLLFIPIVCFGQTYEDIVSIDSKEQFIRIGVENDYELITKNDNSITLGIEPKKDKNGEDVASGFATYGVTDFFTDVSFQFLRNNIFEKKKYDDIFSFVKKNLKFKEVVSDASFYTIDDKRSIGFTLDKDWCYVLFYTYYE